jgi:hypothetical protein
MRESHHTEVKAVVAEVDREATIILRGGATLMDLRGKTVLRGLRERRPMQEKLLAEVKAWREETTEVAKVNFQTRNSSLTKAETIKDREIAMTAREDQMEETDSAAGTNPRKEGTSRNLKIGATKDRARIFKETPLQEIGSRKPHRHKEEIP